jgi:hypothetical protein
MRHLTTYIATGFAGFSPHDQLSFPSVHLCPNLPSSVTTINPKIPTGHEAARIAKEKNGGTAVFLGHAQPAEHIILGPEFAALRVDVEERFCHCGDDVTGGDCVDADTVGAPFHGEVLCELDDGGLGWVVETAN